MAWFRWNLKRMISFLLIPFWIFPIKKKQIFFLNALSFTWGDNLKYLALKLKEESTDDFCLIYAYKSPEQKNFLQREHLIPVQYKSLKYFFYILTSKIIVTNSGGISYLPIRKKQIVLNTWHGGGAYKKVGSDVRKDIYYIKDCRLNANKTTAVLLSCQKFNEYEVPSMFFQSCELLPFGLPRNDIFFQNDWKLKAEIREELGLNQEEKVVLYAPTFRNSQDNILLKKQAYDGNLDVNKLLNAFHTDWGGEWRFFYRLHPQADGKLFKNELNAVDVSGYSDPQRILYIADVLITDYSSITWDFSLTGRPCFLYVPDIERYEHSRDFYVPISEWPYPLAKNNTELVNQINKFDAERYQEDLKIHQQFLGSYEKGNASKKTAQWILSKCCS